MSRRVWRREPVDTAGVFSLWFCVYVCCLSLEPLSIIVFSSLMGLASLELIINSSRDIANGVSDGVSPPTTNLTVWLILGIVISSQTVLFFWCAAYRKESPVIDALAQDHRNDIMNNIGSVVALILATQVGARVRLSPVGCFTRPPFPPTLPSASLLMSFTLCSVVYTVLY